MGKSGRHKKLNRQEKAKTQLKGVRKLEKAQNVVNPTLKVKRIVIREQLQGHGHEEGAAAGQGSFPSDTQTTRRNQSLQEILSSLHHHNTNIRKDALSGLLEIITTSSRLSSIDKILDRIAALTSDLEGSIRKENLKVADALFKRIQDEEIQPFWPLILTHLKCSLTHLNASVRYATLPFFRLLISHFPLLVAESADIILASFLSLISSSGESKGESTTHLKVEISQRKDQVGERLKVFQLIDSCLRLKSIQKLTKGGGPSMKGRELEVKVDWETGEKFQTVDNTLSLPLFSEGPETNLGFQGLFYPFGYDDLQSQATPSLGDILGHSSFHSSGNGNEFWPKFSTSCISCLTETWIEASASLEPNSRKGSDKKSEYSNKSQNKGFLGLGTNLMLTNKEGGGSSSFTSTNLNSPSLDSLQTLVNVMAQLLLENDFDAEVITSSNLPQNSFLHQIRSLKGGELRRHFFTRVPFTAILDSDKTRLTTVNLQLFLIAAHLKLMDALMLKRFEALIDDLISDEKGSLDWEQCSLILRFLRCPDPLGKGRGRRRGTSTSKKLGTDFISWILLNSKHKENLGKYLTSLLHPEKGDTEQEEEDGLFLVENLDWDVITEKLMEGFHNHDKAELFCLLRLITLRNLADVKSHLQTGIRKFKDELKKLPTKELDVWDACLSLFWQAGALELFKRTFHNFLPHNWSGSGSALLEETENKEIGNANEEARIGIISFHPCLF